jgi:hypothetical protein
MARQPYSARKLYLPGDLEAQIEAFITDYKHLRVRAGAIIPH